MSSQCPENSKLWKTTLTDKHLETWIPLHRRESNVYECANGKTDCGAQCLALLNIVNEENALLLARVAKDSGLTNRESNIIIKDNFNSKRKVTSISNSTVINLTSDNLYEFLNKNLQINEATLIGLIKKRQSEMGHFVVVRKTGSHKLQLLCAQTQEGIEGDFTNALKKDYDYFLFTCIEEGGTQNTFKRVKHGGTKSNKPYKKAILKKHTLTKRYKTR